MWVGAARSRDTPYRLERTRMSESRTAFSYFMVRLRHSSGGGSPVDGSIAGLVEHLGTGEKRSFSSGDELLRLVGSWTHGTEAKPVHLLAGD